MTNIYIAGSSDNDKIVKNNYMISSSTDNNEVTEYINDDETNISTKYTITDTVNWSLNDTPSSILSYDNNPHDVYKYHGVVKTTISRSNGIQSIIDTLNRKITSSDYGDLIPIDSKLTPHTLNIHGHSINIKNRISLNRDTYTSQLVKNILNRGKILTLKVPNKKIYQIKDNIISNIVEEPTITKKSNNGRSVIVPKSAIDIFIRIEYSTNLRYENGVFKSISGGKVLSPLLKFSENMSWNGFIFTSYDVDDNNKGINIGRLNDKYISENINLNIDNTNIEYIIKEVIVI